MIYFFNLYSSIIVYIGPKGYNFEDINLNEVTGKLIFLK